MAANTVYIGLVGMPGCGKSTVADYLVKKYKAEKIHLGDFIWQWLARQGIKPSEETGTMAALYMWVEYGDIPLAKWAYDRAKKSKAKIVILDSLRTVEEARFFQLKFGNAFHVIAVLAAPAVRLKRLQSRARFGQISKLEFRIRDREELRLGVGDLIASANHYIDANQPVPKVQKQTDTLIKRLVSGLR
ncbi:MAG: AAA family ATPase [Candidatus Paceibacteria bacterium]